MSEVELIAGIVGVAVGFLAYGGVVSILLVALPKLVYKQITGKYPKWRPKTRWEKHQEAWKNRMGAVKTKQIYSSDGEYRKIGQKTIDNDN